MNQDDHSRFALNVRVMAANSILDRGWGKPAQTTTITITKKRSTLDWTTDELVAFLNEHATDGDGVPEKKSDGAPAKKAGDREPDSVHYINVSNAMRSRHRDQRARAFVGYTGFSTDRLVLELSD